MNTRIRELRHSLGLNQSEFAKRLHLVPQTISMIENGSRSVTDRLVHNLCTEFGVCEEWIRSGNGEIFEASSRRERIMAFAATLPEDGFKTKLIDVLASLDENGWAAMERYARMLLENPEYRKDGEEN